MGESGRCCSHAESFVPPKKGFLWLLFRLNQSHASQLNECTAHNVCNIRRNHTAEKCLACFATNHLPSSACARPDVVSECAMVVAKSRQSIGDMRAKLRNEQLRSRQIFRSIHISPAFLLPVANDSGRQRNRHIGSRNNQVSGRVSVGRRDMAVRTVLSVHNHVISV